MWVILVYGILAWVFFVSIMLAPHMCAGENKFSLSGTSYFPYSVHICSSNWLTDDPLMYLVTVIPFISIISPLILFFLFFVVILCVFLLPEYLFRCARPPASSSCGPAVLSSLLQSFPVLILSLVSFFLITRLPAANDGSSPSLISLCETPLILWTSGISFLGILTVSSYIIDVVLNGMLPSLSHPRFDSSDCAFPTYNLTFIYLLSFPFLSFSTFRCFLGPSRLRFHPFC